MIWRVLSMALWLNKFYAGRRGPAMVRDGCKPLMQVGIETAVESRLIMRFFPVRGHFLILIAAGQSNRFIHPRVPMSV